MMPHTRDPHLEDDVLHDLVDGRLSDVARAGAEAHVARCDGCARRVARLRALLAAAAGLPRELDPVADGWPALRARLRAGAAADGRPAIPLRAHPTATTGAVPRAARRVGPRLPLLGVLAAALLLGAVGAWRAWRQASVPGLAPAVATTPAVPMADPDAAARFATVERDYARAAAELEAQLDATRDRLPETVVASLDRSLATIDTALVEARTALREDPGNPDLARFVAASYEHKLELLRRSTAITSGD